MPVKLLTKPELRALAREIAEGRVYTDRHIPPTARNNRGYLGRVFLPVALMTSEEIVQLGDVGLYYESIDKAAPHEWNGLPIFYSMRMVRRSQVTKLFQLVGRYRKHVQSWQAPVRVEAEPGEASTGSTGTDVSTTPRTTRRE